MFLPKFGKRLSERSRAPVHLEKAPRVEEGPAALVARATAPLRTLRLAAERPAVGVCTLAFLRRPALATAPRLLEGQLRSDKPHVDQLVLATLHRAIAPFQSCLLHLGALLSRLVVCLNRAVDQACF